MNAIQILSSQPWVERLGWTLVHFLWQGSLIAALYAGARKAVNRISSPNTRYLLACAALASYDGRSTHHVDPHGTVRRHCGLRVSHPQCSPSLFCDRAPLPFRPRRPRPAYSRRSFCHGSSRSG